MQSRVSVYRFGCDVQRYCGALFAGSVDDYDAWVQVYLDRIHGSVAPMPTPVPIKLDYENGALAPIIGGALGFGFFCVTALADQGLVEYLRTVAELYPTTIDGLAIVNVINVVDCLDLEPCGLDGAGLPARYNFDTNSLPEQGLFRVPITRQGEVLLVDYGIEHTFARRATLGLLPAAQPRLLWDSEEGAVENPHRMLWEPR